MATESSIQLVYQLALMLQENVKSFFRNKTERVGVLLNVFLKVLSCAHMHVILLVHSLYGERYTLSRNGTFC